VLVEGPWDPPDSPMQLKLRVAPVNIPQSVLGVKVSDLVREIQDRFRGGGV